MVWDAIKHAAWQSYKQITDFYWRKLDREFKEKPDFKTANAIRRAAFADMIIDLYNNDERSLWMVFQDPKVRKYIKMEMRDMTNSFISTLTEKGADARLMSMMVPEYQLEEYDKTHDTAYAVPAKYSHELQIPSEEDMATEFEAYQVFVKTHYGQSSKGEKRPINSSDDSGNETEASNAKTPKKERPTDTTTKKPEQDLSLIEEEEANQSQPIMDVDTRAGGASNPSGHHGTFHGDTHINKIWEKNRWEREYIHSENEFCATTYWGMSKYNSDFLEDDTPYVKDFSLVEGTKTGLVCLDEGFANKSMAYPYNADSYSSVTDLVYGVPINFYVRDFLDYKTLNGTSGRLRYYNRIVLESITVDITIHTKAGGFNKNEWYINNIFGTESDRTSCRNAEKDFTWIPRYFVFRDAEGDYTSQGLIKFNSEYQTAGTEAKPSFKLRSLKQKDKTATVVTNKFSFTRKVASGGPYFLTPNKLWDLRNSSISTLINEIEGQSADNTGNLQKWPEFLNLIIAPIMSDMIMFKVAAGVAITPNFHSQFHIKCSAKWSARDNSTVQQTVGNMRIKDDPFYRMNENLKQEITSQINTR